MTDVGPPPVEAILAVHRAAIDAVVDVTAPYLDDDWQRTTPCDPWTALDLAGHVVTAATMWHEALDDAEAGVSSARWRWADMARHNAEYLAALPQAAGPERICEFADLLAGWCIRVAAAEPDLPIPVAVQDVCPEPLTVSTFAWIGGVEFHLHAWDFAQTIGATYRAPDHAPSLLAAQAALWGTPVPDGDPWDEVIRRFRS